MTLLAITIWRMAQCMPGNSCWYIQQPPHDYKSQTACELDLSQFVGLYPSETRLFCEGSDGPGKDRPSQTPWN